MTFCGNPENHERHPWDQPIQVNGLIEYRVQWCDGVQRVIRQGEEVVIEKFDPSELSEDGTKYVTVKIFIEDGDETTIIEIPKASHLQFEVDYQSYISLDNVPVDGELKKWEPHIDLIRFSTQPEQYEEGPKFSVRKMKNNG